LVSLIVFCLVYSFIFIFGIFYHYCPVNN
jgi:hypothetical protein